MTDKEFRKVIKNLEWSLELQIFDKIRLVYGPVTIGIDVFAAQINARV